MQLLQLQIISVNNVRLGYSSLFILHLYTSTILQVGMPSVGRLDRRSRKMERVRKAAECCFFRIRLVMLPTFIIFALS